MSRKPAKLDQKRWDEIGERLLNGEPARALAREFKVSDTAIRKRFSSQHQKMKQVASQLVNADQSLRELPLSSQIQTLNFASKLKTISNHLAGAAELSSMTSNRLAELAFERMQQMQDGEITEGDIRDVAILTRTSNEASSLGMNLINQNKTAMEDNGSEGARSLDDFYASFDEGADT